MLRALVLDRSDLSFREIEPNELRKACDEPELVLWVDVQDPDEAELERLRHEFGFHLLAIEDCRNRHQRPKVDEYSGYYFIVLYEVSLVGERRELELRELNIFLGRNYVVSVHSQPLRAIDTAARLWPSWLDPVNDSAGTSELLPTQPRPKCASEASPVITRILNAVLPPSVPVSCPV